MANAVKSNHSVMESYKQDKVIFIIDECHRTQFGDMHRLIKQHFENAQYFGFTGHHVLKKIRAKMGVLQRHFDTCLHHYLIKDAIRDHNVLGFQLNTIKHLIHMTIWMKSICLKLIRRKFGWQMNVLKLFVDT